MKRIINGFEGDWASERVFAERQTAPSPASRSMEAL
jgi:hypothetical protein